MTRSLSIHLEMMLWCVPVQREKQMRALHSHFSHGSLSCAVCRRRVDFETLVKAVRLTRQRKRKDNDKAGTNVLVESQQSTQGILNLQCFETRHVHQDINSLHVTFYITTHNTLAGVYDASRGHIVRTTCVDSTAWRVGESK